MSAQEDLGFLDLIELGEEKFLSVREISNRMASAIDNLGKNMVLRAAEMNSLKTSSPNVDKKQAKRIADQSAEDMQQFVKHINIEIPLFAETYSSATDAYARAAVLWTDFHSDDKHAIENSLNTVKTLRSSLLTAQKSMRGFYSAVERLPRLTKELNQAKRETLNVVGLLCDEFSAAIETTGETEKVMEEILAEKNVEDGKAKIENLYLSQLRENLAKSFNEQELRTLCFDLGVDFEDLPALGKGDKARELVSFFDRNNRLTDLTSKCKEIRPNINWDSPDYKS